jgi:hypothetical protein
MALELLAATNPQSQEYQQGLVVGIAIAVVICGCIPIVAGLKKNQPVLGFVGGFCAGGSAVVLGCLLGLPVALVFVAIINAVGSGSDSQARRREQEEADDLEDYRRRRERGLGDDDEPRPRSRPWDNYDNDDDEPRSRRRRDYD